MSIPNLSSPFLQTKPIQKNSLTTSETNTHESFLEQENEQDNGDDGEILGVILSRTLSMRSERHSSVESAVRRAFSMRLSTPVASEGYHRIIDHHRCNSDEDDERLIAPDAEKLMDMDNKPARQTRTNKRRGNNIFEACRRLLGF